MAVLSPASRPVQPDDETPVSLAHAPVGWRRRVVSIEEPARTELAQEGLFPGATVVVTARTPLGGPVVVELGRTRLAMSAGVAAPVVTTPLRSTPGVAHIDPA
jgi:Fe2+ transport system protein FeoA